MENGAVSVKGIFLLNRTVRNSMFAGMIDLKARIRELGLRQKGIAARMGVSTVAMHEWVNRHRPVPPHHMREFADILEISLYDLVPETKKAADPSPQTLET